MQEKVRECNSRLLGFGVPLSSLGLGHASGSKDNADIINFWFNAKEFYLQELAKMEERI